MEVKTFYGNNFPENCYAVILNESIFLVDPGEMTKELLEFVTENSNRIKYILLTHKHIDHIGAVYKIKNLLPEIKIVIHTLDSDGLLDSKKSLALYFSIPQEKINADILCSDGEVIKIEDKEVLVFHTPGHSVGSVCYIIDNLIFTGDTLFENSCGRTDFPDGDNLAMAESLKKIKNLKGDFILYPGHGNPTKLSVERIHNPYMRNL